MPIIGIAPPPSPSAKTAIMATFFSILIVFLLFVWQVENLGACVRGEGWSHVFSNGVDVKAG